MFYLNIFLNTLGAILFLYAYWKRLKSDFAPEQIFASALLVLIFTLVFSAASYFFYPAGWFWITATGALLAIIISSKKFAVRFIEGLEAAFVAFLPWLFIVYLYSFIKTQNVLAVSLIAVVILSFVVFLLVDRNYKKIAWYKSGKVGIAGLITIITFTLLRMLIGIAASDMLSFLGIYDIILSVAVIITCSVSGVLLARQKNK